MRKILAVLISLLVVGPAVGQIQNHVLEQTDAPFLIQSFDTSSENAGTTYPKRIEYEMKGRNIGTNDIVAVQIAVLSFTPFGRLLDFGTWTKIDKISPSHSGGNPKSISFYSPNSQAHRHFRGIAYLRRARMEDGRIWRANPDSIEKQVRTLVNQPGLSLPSDSAEAAKPLTSI